MEKNKDLLLMCFYILGMALIIITVINNLLSHLWV